MMLLVVEMRSVLIPTGLLIMIGALEEAEGLTRGQLFGSLLDPCFGHDIVSEEDGGWVWVVIVGCNKNGGCGCN